MKQLNVGIIGYGRSGRDIHRSYLNTDKTKFKIVAVADPLEDRRKRAQVECECDINGGLKGSLSHIDWKYFIPAEAPEQHLISEPLTNIDGSFAFCSEQLKWYEDSRDVTEDMEEYFFNMSKSYYTMLYDYFVDGREPDVTLEQVEQVRIQIMIIEECHRQNAFNRDFTSVSLER